MITTDGTLSLAVWLWSGESFVRLISGPEMFKMFVFDINKREMDIFICHLSRGMTLSTM